MARDDSRRRARRRREGSALAQLPLRAVRNPYRPIEVLSADQIEAIHDASMRILEEIGMDFLHPEALDILAEAGAAVEPGSQRVRFDRGLIEHALGHAPSAFTLHARNPARNLTIGGNHINFATVGSAPNVSDLERGRRDGNYADYCDLIRLAQAFNIIHHMGGYPVEPVDLPPETRHLDATLAFITLSDKAFHGYSLGRTRIVDTIEMTRIARGLSEAALAREPSLFSVINTSSPLRLDGPMIEGVFEMARRNQPLVITPFTLAGAMSPVALAGALAQQNAEALAGLALAQTSTPARRWSTAASPRTST